MAKQPSADPDARVVDSFGIPELDALADSENPPEVIVHMEGVLSKGYGITPAIVNRNPEVDPEAKTIYNYLATFTGRGDTAFPSCKNMLYELKMGKNRFYKYRRQLLDFKYIEVTRRRRKNGFMSTTGYNLKSHVPISKEYAEYLNIPIGELDGDTIEVPVDYVEQIASDPGSAAKPHSGKPEFSTTQNPRSEPCPQNEAMDVTRAYVGNMEEFSTNESSDPDPCPQNEDMDEPQNPRSAHEGFFAKNRVRDTEDLQGRIISSSFTEFTENPSIQSELEVVEPAGEQQPPRPPAMTTSPWEATAKTAATASKPALPEQDTAPVRTDGWTDSEEGTAPSAGSPASGLVPPSPLQNIPAQRATPVPPPPPYGTWRQSELATPRTPQAQPVQGVLAAPTEIDSTSSQVPGAPPANPDGPAAPRTGAASVEEEILAMAALPQANAAPAPAASPEAATPPLPVPLALRQGHGPAAGPARTETEGFAELAAASVNRNMLDHESGRAATMEALDRLVAAGYSSDEVKRAWGKRQDAAQASVSGPEFMPQLKRWLEDDGPAGAKSSMDAERVRETRARSSERSVAFSQMAATDATLSSLVGQARSAEESFGQESTQAKQAWMAAWSYFDARQD